MGIWKVSILGVGLSSAFRRTVVFFGVLSVRVVLEGPRRLKVSSSSSSPRGMSIE